MSSTLLFFSPTRTKPRSTLFPYTTLFRSFRVRQHERSGRRRHDGLQRERRTGGQPDRHGDRNERLAERDRKSTRLNSSHGYISYAVFCLKKKMDCLKPSHARSSTLV